MMCICSNSQSAGFKRKSLRRHAGHTVYGCAEATTAHSQCGTINGTLNPTSMITPQRGARSCSDTSAFAKAAVTTGLEGRHSSLPENKRNLQREVAGGWETRNLSLCRVTGLGNRKNFRVLVESGCSDPVRVLLTVGNYLTRSITSAGALNLLFLVAWLFSLLVVLGTSEQPPAEAGDKSAVRFKLPFQLTYPDTRGGGFIPVSGTPSREVTAVRQPPSYQRV